MRTTTTALAVGATVLAIPASANADVQSDIRVPLAGHLSVKSQMTEHHRELAQRRLTRKATRVARALAHARGRGFSARAYRRRIADESPARLAARVRSLRRELKRARQRQRASASANASASPTLEAIAACESGGNPATNTGNGFYGKYQFTLSTWQSVGGTGNPAEASEAEQNKRAAILYAREGASPWPVCGR
ncbi:MAG TPA: transglycosylase family protein [Solirubrobacter sp.]|nr:transglycosylase family protein [Solirubrobacter sp.]